MNGWFDRRARLWAAAAAVGGIVLLIGTKLVEDPDSSVGDVLLELVESLPVILTSGYSEVLAENAHVGFELIQKPYSVESLSRVLRKAIVRPESGAS